MQELDFFSTKTVLYAEDDVGIIKEVVEILKLFFDKVFYANNGKDALELYYEKKPDLLILDVCMPIMDGLDVLKEIRKIDLCVVAIIITAHDEREYLKKTVELNIFKYLSKPFSRDSFLQALIQSANLIISRLGGAEVYLDKDMVYSSINKSFCSSTKCEFLSKKESALFEYFLKNRGKILHYDELISEIWNYNSGNKESLKALRKKISA